MYNIKLLYNMVDCLQVQLTITVSSAGKFPGT